MASVCILDEFEVHKNEKFLRIAEELRPKLHATHILPERIIKTAENEKSELEVCEEESLDKLKENI
jgi:hypothetical protein